MKRFVGFIAMAFVAIGFVGCGDDLPKTDTKDIATDGRPKGFEDMMKGMQKDMSKAGKNPKAANK